MIQLPEIPLPEKVARRLEAWQDEVDALPDYPTRVEAAVKRFKTRNKKDDPTFGAVRSTLAEMCSGSQRCVYCEDSAAYQVEHVHPKAIYPDMVFRWPNYVFACGWCNGPKSDQFEVFQDPDDVLVDVTRWRGSLLQAPAPGSPVLIHPRTENGLDFLSLDLAGTFLFLPRQGLSPRNRIRAERTITILRLNARDALAESRNAAFNDYLAHLERYVEEKHRNAQDLAERRARLMRRGHPTVWFEMRRQRESYSTLAALFGEAPELL
jgi:uncharacterized protein (TIGR02646 family)